MVQQPTFASRGAARLHFPTKPLIVLDRSTKQLQRDLIGISAGFGGNLIQPGFKFGRDVQVHKGEGRGEGEGLSTLRAGDDRRDNTPAPELAEAGSSFGGGRPAFALLRNATARHLRLHS